MKVTNVVRENYKKCIFTYQQWLLEIDGKMFSVRQFRNSKHNRRMKRVGLFEAYDINNGTEAIFKTLDIAKAFIEKNGAIA